MVATVVGFLDAFNSGRVDVALTFLTDDVAISDCDYRAVHVTLANGAEAARQWLRRNPLLASNRFAPAGVPARPASCSMRSKTVSAK